jgi:hypothetical protein
MCDVQRRLQVLQRESSSASSALLHARPVVTPVRRKPSQLVAATAFDSTMLQRCLLLLLVLSSSAVADDFAPGSSEGYVEQRPSLRLSRFRARRAISRQGDLIAGAENFCWCESLLVCSPVLVWLLEPIVVYIYCTSDISKHVCTPSCRSSGVF